MAQGDGEKIQFRHITVEEGLSNNTVFCIVQDHTGFMWFGTNDGLNRFDSHNFRIYHHNLNDSVSLWDNRIITLMVDSKDRLWVGTAKGLNLYDRKRDCFVRYLPDNFREGTFEFYIRTMAEDRAGRIWVGTSYGLYLFDPVSGRFVVHDPDAPIPTMFLDKNIVKIRPGPAGDYWLCTTNGLYTWDGREIGRSPVHNSPAFAYSGEEFRDILRDRRGHYWLATESLQHGIFHFDAEMDFVGELVNKPGAAPDLAGNRVRVLTQLTDGKIWVGTFEGLSRLDPLTGKIRHFKPNKYDPRSLKGRSVRAIYEDHDGGVWLATYNGGINYYHPSFNVFQHEQADVWRKNSLSDNLVSSFAEQDRHSLWIGTEYGLNHYDRSSGRYTHYYRHGENGLLDNTIKSLELDLDGNLWVGSLQGLSRFDLGENAFTHYVHDIRDNTSIGRGHVHVIYRDRSGMLWVGTNGGGLNLFDPEGDRFIRFTEIEKQPKTYVTHINALAEGIGDVLWAGTSNGLQCFDRKKRIFVRPEVLQNDVFRLLAAAPVLTLHTDRSKHLWIGSHGFGLVVLDLTTGRHRRLTTEDGLPDNTIKGIQLDDSGNAWVSSNRGLTRITVPDQGWMAVKREHVVNFNTTDGLQGYQYYRNAALRLTDGKLLFGGTNGYNTFDPESVEKTIIVPEVIFTGLTVRNEGAVKNVLQHTISGEGGGNFTTLTSRQSDFSIEFAALNYYDPENSLYAYMLEPVNQDWQVLGATPVVNFSQLAPGAYVFKVKATNSPDHWGSGFSRLHIQISPPFWRTGWAYLLYIVAISVLLFTFFQVATRWGKLKSDLVYEHHEREKEHALHQQRIRFFTNISHELRTPLTLILAPLEHLVKQDIANNRLRNQLIMIQRNGERMLQLINQLLDLRKLETGHMKLRAAQGDIVRFIREIALAFRETAEYKGIHFSTHLPDGPLQYWYDRDKMEIILYNLLSNAIKNTPEGGNIGIYVRPAAHGPDRDGATDGEGNFPEGYLEIVVEDDGRGISEKNLRHIFNRFYQVSDKEYSRTYGSGVGLEIVKRFMDLHKGSIDVESYQAWGDQPGKTRFMLKVPAGKQHLDPTDILEDFRSSEDIALYRHPDTYSVAGQDTALEDEKTTGVPMEGDQALQNERVTLLIVEDNAEVRRFIVGLFRLHYRILEASHGVEGLALALEHVPDLVLSDVMMPEMDGMELCRKVKTDPRTSHIPVILLSARTAVTHRIEGMETGADDYVTKPFSADELSARVKNLIDQRKRLRVKYSKQLHMAPEDISITSVDEKLLRRTTEYIQQHMSDPDLNVEKVASEVGMSRVHFYRKIRALTNLSPVAFIRRIRLERSAQLLQTGKLNVSEVRYAIGIQDPNYFRKVFKEYFGHAPSHYGDGVAEDQRNRNSRG